MHAHRHVSTHDMRFGDLLKRLRKQRGFTLRDLGKLSGIDHAYIYRLETGEKGTPSNEIVQALTIALKLDSRRAHILEFLVRQPVADDLVTVMLEDHEYSPGDFESAAQMSFRGARPRGKNAWRKLLRRLQEMREEFERDEEATCRVLAVERWDTPAPHVVEYDENSIAWLIDLETARRRVLRHGAEVTMTKHVQPPYSM